MSEMKHLGQKSQQPQHPDEAELDTFANPAPGRDFVITLDCPEFTSLCPITGQPDFAHMIIQYIPNELCIESKALKLYLGSFRNIGSFHEAVTNRILDDLVEALQPKWMEVIGDFSVRGGISICINAQHGRKEA